MDRKRFMRRAMFCGILGCLCYGGDWLMIYGNPSYSGSLFWLTDGVADISAWRNTLAMVLAFPGIILYGIALFSLKELIRERKEQKRYSAFRPGFINGMMSESMIVCFILWAVGGSYYEGHHGN